MPLVSVVTATIPERERLLAECKASVQAQTFRYFEHVIVPDYERVGCARTTNAAVAKAKGKWLLPLADDDLLFPGCLEALLSVSEGWDVVYPIPVVWGELPNQFCGEPPNIPATALIRMEAWRSVGGYNAGLPNREDNDLWSRMLGQSKRFLRYDASPTWLYRFHGENKSRR